MRHTCLHDNVPVRTATVAGLVMGLVADPPAHAAAQEIHGTLVSEGQSVAGAVVWLLEADRRITRVFTDSLGRFLVRAGKPGTFVLLAERIGMTSARSGSLDVGADGVRGYVFDIAPSPVDLPAIAVDADRRCSGISDGDGTYRVWDEARKSLEAIVLTEGLAQTRLAVVSFERELDARSLAVRQHVVSTRAVLSRVPLRSSPPDELAREGYIRESGRSIEYFAPDATVLLSTSFADLHCFRLNFSDDRPDQVGLEFRPISQTGVPDVEGTLWLDRQSRAVVDLEFQFTRLPWPVRDPRIGGYLAFEQLGNGQHIVRCWWLRMPILTFRIGRTIGHTVLGYWQIGAEVVEQASLLAGTVDRLHTLSPETVATARADSSVRAATDNVCLRAPSRGGSAGESAEPRAGEGMFLRTTRDLYGLVLRAQRERVAVGVLPAARTYS